MDEILNGFVSSRDLINWQTQMSNTAHQREVADLKAAGLNPVLSAHTNGASTPSGSHDDLSTLLDAVASSVENTGKAVASMAKNKENSDGDAAWDVISGIAQSVGLGNLANAGGKIFKGMNEFVENHPEVFDETWQHHNAAQSYAHSSEEQRDKEKEYRSEKKGAARDRFRNWWQNTMQNSAKAAAYVNAGGRH